MEFGPKYTTLVLANGSHGHVFTINAKSGKVSMGSRHSLSLIHI